MSDSITIVGNIAGDLEHRTIASGVDVVTFRLATGGKRRDRGSGEWVDSPPNWYRVSAYRALARNAQRSLHRGQRVIVSGRLRIRAWESADRRGTSVELDADALGPDLLFGTATFAATPKDGNDALGGGDGSWSPDDIQPAW